MTREDSGYRRPRGERESIAPFEDENIPLFTVGQVADMLAVKQAFLRRIDELQVVSPQRSAGRQRRYTRVEIRVIRQVIELEQQLAEVTAHRDELAARLSEVTTERARLTHQLHALLGRVSRDRSEEE
jgi:MerR family transcriptional regulator, heat shock protein HspR